MVKNLHWLNNRVLKIGSGESQKLEAWIPGKRILLVHGGRSLEASGQLDTLLDSLKGDGREIRRYSISGEPSPAAVDLAVEQFREYAPETVVAVGGGSVMDGGKAIAAMFRHPEGVKHYLEGVGDHQPLGETLPLIALPTTSGTGSEATKNAVLSEPGAGGFKKSLRHDRFVPYGAVLDPELTLDCPEKTTRYAGWDCFTQLLESFLSTGSNTLTDMYARQGLEIFLEGFPLVLENPRNREARQKTALAAYISGITLAHAGLGTLHGMAGSLGGEMALPHGQLCSLLIPSYYRFILKEAEKRIKGITADKLRWLGDRFAASPLGIEEMGLPGFREALEKIGTLLDKEPPALPENRISAIAEKSSDKNSPFPTTAEQRERWLRESFRCTAES